MANTKVAVQGAALVADHATVKALQGLVDYQPVNPAYATAQLLQLQASLTQAEHAEKAAEQAYVEARNLRRATAQLYHDSVVGARAQVVAQYGPDAAAVALVGLTRKSERKHPVRRTAGA
jgi:hypothetical protein